MLACSGGVRYLQEEGGNHVNSLTMLGWLTSALGGPGVHAPSIHVAADLAVIIALA